LQEEDAVVRTYSDHTAWVQNVRWHPKLSGQFLSAGLDGQVKLFDLRGADFAAMTWDLQPKTLSAFDVHSISGVFAATSAINHGSWRSQRVVVRSLVQSEPLSTSNIPTGLSTYPIRGIPSPFIPRHSSLVFHPTEMLYAMGGPDGTVRIVGCNLP